MLTSYDIKARYALSRLYEDSSDTGWIRVILEPFVFNTETYETTIRLDGVEGLDDRLLHSAGKRMLFPINPQSGYIDGSIYFHGRHHSVDVYELEFGLHTGDTVPLSLRGVLRIGGWPEFQPFQINLRTRVVLPLTSQGVEKRVAEAIAKTGATSLRQLGSVMAYVRPTLLYEGEAAMVAAKASSALKTTQ